MTTEGTKTAEVAAPPFVGRPVRRAGESPRLTALRVSASESWAASGFPSMHEEAYRFTNVAPIERQAAVSAGTTVPDADTLGRLSYEVAIAS